MIASGAGVGVLPSFIGDRDPALEVVLPEIRIMRSFWLVTHRETHPFGTVRVFTDWLVDLVERHRDVLVSP